VLVLGHTAAKAAPFHDHVLAHQEVDQLLHLGFGERQHRIAVTFLVAGVGQRIDGQRVLIGRGDLLLDQAADHARFGGRQNDADAHHQLPTLGIESQGARGGREGPRCRISIEIWSGERTKAMCPSRGGRLMVTPWSCRRWQTA